MTTQPATQLESRAPTLLEQYRAVRSATDRLTAPLSADDQMVQSCLEASPAKWHRAHTTWFFETFVLAPHARGYREFDARFRYLFNSYYNHVGDRPERTTRAFFSRPSCDEVTGYREYVDGAMGELLSSESLPEDVLDKIELGLHHEQQHQELIVSDIKHALWSNPLRPAYRDCGEHESPVAPALRWFDFAGGIVGIGHAGAGFAFDNESPRHEVLLPAFRLASRLVTNAEYLEFICDGGYRTPTLWLSDGWDAVRLNRWQAPLYWEEREGEWWQFTLSGMRRVVGDDPACHISYFEADAYARWRGVRLPTEFECEHAASTLPVEGNFLESERLHPIAAPESRNSPAQMFGDCWQWTSSAYSAYPGFRPATGALGEYNGKFMCNQYVLRGGSCATPR